MLDSRVSESAIVLVFAWLLLDLVVDFVLQKSCVEAVIVWS